jgi:ABC-2 type transport system ATP-binding protein
MMFAIETLGLTKRYGGSNGGDAVHGVTLSLPRGELFGLFGPNGAGKTTLIRMLTTLLAPTSGEARVNGFDIVREAGAVRASIGLVFANEHSFYGRLSGRQNLNFFAALQGLSPRQTRTRVDELLETFGLQPHADAIFQTYSTGMRQKMNVARALLHNPTVLFLDEPTKGMDVQTADAVRALLKEEIVGRQGKTVFLTTHDLYEMEHLCDRIGVIADGQIQALGEPRELLAQMRREQVFQIELTHPVDGLAARLASLGRIRVTRAEGALLEFVAGEDGSFDQDLWDVIHAAGGRIRRYGPKDEGLRTLLRQAVRDDHLA